MSMSQAAARQTDPAHDGDGQPSLDLSVLVPVFNEAANVGPLYVELDRVLRGLGLRYELVFVDDGSTDGTAAKLEQIQQADPEHVTVAFLRRNCGQTAALSAALDLSRGAVLVPIDGDLQNDPADIPRLLARLDEGFDVVSGWRKDRKDAWLSRRVPSQLANRLVARISRVPLHDFGCTLKAYRRNMLAGVRLYGEMHRFIPVFATWQGARVTELVVNHRPRSAGKTKYGLSRTFNVVFDLILIKFYERYAQRPIHLFGRVGFWSFVLSFIMFFMMLYYKYIFKPPKTFIETPLPALCALFFLGGMISFLMGILAEMVMRTYYESQGKPTYVLGPVRRASASGEAPMGSG
jgi:glycosyltransferase involved in cell wall biosynthesis